MPPRWAGAGWLAGWLCPCCTHASLPAAACPSSLLLVACQPAWLPTCASLLCSHSSLSQPSSLPVAPGTLLQGGEHKGVGPDQLRAKGYVVDNDEAPKTKIENPFDLLNLADE